MPFFKLLYPLLGIYWLAAVLVLLLWRARLCGSGLAPEIAPRPVAYSIELEVRKRFFGLVFWALVLSFIPTYTVLSHARFGQQGGAIRVFTVVGAGLTLLGLVNACKHLRTIHRLRSEREGQLRVAQTLAENASFEHRLFHDVPAKDNAWINHVLVGPQGVFAIETRSEPIGHGKPDGEGRGVTVDGRFLHVSTDPDHRDTRSIAASAGRARWLQTWLALQARTHVAVQPVLVLPGWRVEVKKQSEILVVNQEGLSSLFAGKRTLQPTELHRIADALVLCSHFPAAVNRPRHPLGPEDTTVAS